MMSWIFSVGRKTPLQRRKGNLQVITPGIERFLFGEAAGICGARTGKYVR